MSHDRKQRLKGELGEEQKWKTQRGERPPSLHQTSPEMEQDSSTSLIPFAKRSKMVSRYTLEEDLDISSADYSNGNFWDKLAQQQSSHWTEEYHEAPSLLMSSRVVQRPGEAEGDPFPWPVVSAVQQLPPPKELCRRKKKGARQHRLGKGSVLSVCYHLEELKKRQSSIDELKKATWGGCLPQAFHEGENRTAGLNHRVPPNPFQLCENEASRDIAVHSGAQLLYPEWNSSMEEQQRSLQESPVISYRMASLGRYPTRAACMPEEDFGSQLQSEE